MYGKSKQRNEVEASSGPIRQAELDTWSDEKIAARLKELEPLKAAPESATERESMAQTVAQRDVLFGVAAPPWVPVPLS